MAQAAAMVVVTQTRNYFKSVSENKEITKIISLLSTAINSTKKEVTTGQFSLAQGQKHNDNNNNNNKNNNNNNKTN